MGRGDRSETKLRCCQIFNPGVNCRRFREVVEGASKGGSACPGQAQEERACGANQCPGENYFEHSAPLLLVWAECKSAFLTFFSLGSDDPDLREREPDLVGEYFKAAC